MKRLIVTIFGALLLGGGAAAQAPAYEFRGPVFSSDGMSISDMANLSQTQFNFGTARSMGMGGAFTSLGADLSSMAINPAGLGLYRRSELAFTPLLSISKSEIPAGAYSPGAMPWRSNSRSRFAMGNFGTSINVYENPSTKVISINLGLGYNRLADYNYNRSFEFRGDSNSSSLADALSVMLEAGGIAVGNDGITMGGVTNYRIDPFFWPGVAGYKTFLVDQNANGVWYPAEIGNNATIDGGYAERSKGSLGEFDLSLGMNINNKLYVGATIGIVSLYQHRQLYYGEGYSYNGANGYTDSSNPSQMAYDADGNRLDNVMQSMGMIQASEIDGSGVNFKLGVIYRPLPGLRIGAAFHTPTFYSVNRTYQMTMSTASLGPTNAEQGDYRPFENTSNTTSDLIEDSGDSSWNFYAPARLMVGASYTFGRFAILSVDYERDWYNGIRVKNMPHMPYGQTEWDFKQDFKTYFRGSNMVRAGVELRPLPVLSVRAGFGYAGSMLKEKDSILTAPVNNKTVYYTAGLGMQLGRTVYIDLAYCNSKSTSTDYLLYYGAKYAADYNEVYSSDLYRNTLRRHSVALTLGFRL